MRWVWVSIVPLVVNFALILPLFVPSILVSTQTEDTLRVLHLNLDRHNTNVAGVAGYIQQTDADIIFLQEVTPTWLSEIESQDSMSIQLGSESQQIDRYSTGQARRSRS